MDNEILVPLTEADIEKIKRDIRFEFAEMQLELEKQRSVNLELLQQTRNKIDIAKSEITETAINKTLEMLSHVRNWVGMLAVVAGLATFFGYKSFESEMKNYFKSKVENWLKLDDSESDGKKALDQLRTEAMLNAYTIRLARSLASPFDVHTNDLRETEIQRLLEIALDPKTSNGDFVDALRLLTNNRMPFAILRPNDSVGKKLTGILSSEKYDAFKKGEIFEFMEKDESLTVYSKAILADESANEDVKAAALKNISYFDEAFALNFSKEHLLTFKHIIFQMKLAEYVAENDPQYPPLKQFLNSLITNKPDEWKRNYIIVLLKLFQSKKSSYETKKFCETSFTFLIDEGLKIILNDGSFGSRYILIDAGSVYANIDDPKSFLSDKIFISSIINNHKIDLEWLIKAASFFQIMDRDYFLSTLIMTPAASTKFIFEDSSSLISNEVLDDIWLKTASIAGRKTLTAIWRDKAGVIHNGQVKEVTDARQASYRVSFDDEVMTNLSARKYNPRYY